MIAWRCRKVPAIVVNALLVVFFSLFLMGSFSVAQADTQSIDRSATISATIEQRQAPPTPILISPPNGALLTSGVVTFVWKEVTGHITPLSHYELSLNGQKKFGNISLTPESNADYVLTFDGSQYSLKLTNDHWLPDGAYTWKIRVVDSNNLGTDSTTWSFTIDSQPPPLLIVEIDDKPTSISAADPTTVPVTPITVRHNDPEIKGKTQALSEVQLVVTYPDGHTWLYKTFASEYGDFTFQLEDLPKNEVVQLLFTAIDPWFNTTVLSGIKLIYKPRVIHIIIPLPIPHPPEITIYYTLPRLPHFLATPIPRPSIFPTPTATLLPAPSGRPIVRVVEVPLFPLQPWMLLWLVAVSGYVVALYWLSGNRWRYFGEFLLKLGRWWLIGVGRLPHRYIQWPKRQSLPLVRSELWWLDTNHRRRQRAVWSSPMGTWDFPFVSGVIYSMNSSHANWQYPIEWEEDSATTASNRWRGVSEALEEPSRAIFVNGESWVVNDQTTPSVRTSPAVVVVTPSLEYHWEVWFHWRREGQKWAWWWLPRFLLLLALIIGIILVVFRRDAWSVILVLIPLGMGWRDAQWQLPKQWQTIYHEK